MQILLALVALTLTLQPLQAKQKKIVLKKSSKKITDSELKSLQADLSTTKQIKADFTLTQTRKLRKKPIVRSGTAQFGIPNMFVWHIKNNPEVIQYFNGKKFVQYYPKNKLAQQITPTGDMYQTISRLVDVVLNWSAIKDDYSFEKATWKNKDAHIQLAPKDRSSKIATIDLVVSSQFKFVKSITLNYVRGNKTNIAFSKLQRMKANKSVFAFNRPSGIRLEVVK